MRRLDPGQVQERSIVALGLDPLRHPLTSVEAIAAALRRAAGFLCPCASTSLVRSVMAPLRGLVPDSEITKGRVEDTLEHLIAHGDLLEYRDFASSKSSAIVVYAAPRSFVSRNSGSVILVGISADQVSALPQDLEQRIETVGTVRMLRSLPQENLRADLLQIGLIEIPYDRWTKHPPTRAASQHVTHYEALLKTGPSSGDVSGLTVLDPTAPVRFYRGRWVDPKGQTGRFVARRLQAYGAPLWCHVQLQDGQAEYLLDFPSANVRWRGCDEAWHLQMAIDSVRQGPQLFRLRTEEPGTQDLLLYSPIPMWAQRRWDAIGQRIEADDCLIAYRFLSSEVDEEARLAVSTMWLALAQDPT